MHTPSGMCVCVDRVHTECMVWCTPRLGSGEHTCLNGMRGAQMNLGSTISAYQIYLLTKPFQFFRETQHKTTLDSTCTYIDAPIHLNCGPTSEGGAQPSHTAGRDVPAERTEIHDIHQVRARPEIGSKVRETVRISEHAVTRLTYHSLHSKKFTAHYRHRRQTLHTCRAHNDSDSIYNGLLRV